MDNRWQMNRIGFVNFWLYDNESFEFENGKILLRGQNGSGKSITTQSFIPFILDGDRSPSRLDPFGTSDRKMEYYFLGEGDKDESTGYLYLEFRKQNTDEYKTIGIGQNARRGRPMSFWGFIIKNNRRVGIDLNLYRQSGDKLIPLDKQELKKEIGEENLFTDSPKVYKELVNENLFKFERIDQYDQFIKLLIKVRAPKLSNNFKPTRVYEILNDSLQVLSNDDLRPMVDAMEKMDSIQENLDGLRRSLKDATQIMKEYEHYNRYMLAKKAHNYIEGDKNATESNKAYVDKINEVKDLKEKQISLTSQIELLKTEERSIRSEIEELTDSSIENLDIKIQNLNYDLKEKTENNDKKEKQIQQKREKIRSIETEIQNLSDQIDFKKKQINDYLKEMDSLQEDLRSEFHDQIKQNVSEETEIDFDLYSLQINSLKNCIDEGKKVLTSSRDAEYKYNEAIVREEENKRKYIEKTKEYDDLNKQKELEQDVLLNALEDLKNNEFWNVDQETILFAKDIVENYLETNDSLKLQDVLRKDYNAKERKKNEQIALLGAKEKQIKEELNQKVVEYQEVQKQKIIEPKRDDDTTEVRRLLSEAGIQAYPFYQTIEFNDSLTPQEQAILEQQLYKAGILDALVASKENYQRIQREFPELNDVMIYESQNTGSNFEDLIVDHSMDQSIQDVVCNILSQFSKDHGSLVLKKTGYFKHGLIEGHAIKTESEYIGVNARKRKKEQLLKALDEEIKALREQINTINIQINDEQHILEEMENEYHSVHDTKTINQFILKLKALKVEIEELSKKRDQLEKETIEKYNNFKQKEREMMQVCSLLPYARNIDEYEEISRSLDEYRNIFYNLKDKIKDRYHFQEQIQTLDNSKEDALNEIDNLSLERDFISNKIQAINEQIIKFQELIDNPEIKEQLRRLQEAKERLDENSLKQTDSGKKLAIVEDKLSRIDADLEDKKKKKEEDEEYLKCVRQYFEEELNLHFVIEENEKELKDNALDAINVEEKNYMNKSVNDMVSSLYSIYQKNNSNLINYNSSIDTYFSSSENTKAERSRVVVVLIKNGKKLHLSNFIHELKNSIDIQEELIREKDRELFEDILSQTISRKLSDRIDESKNLIKEMSNLMKNMDTSMGLSFSLDWKPKNPEDRDELDAIELEKLLTKDNALVTEEEMSKVSTHFRKIIQKEKQTKEDNGEIPNYNELVMNALDYRKWYEFKMSFKRENDVKKELTNAAFNRFSGGEKAMAMYVPLFAAVNAQYEKTKASDHPRIIALDEAFAGVDSKNISSMFEMVEKLDFDYIMNSQVLWGCYETVKRLKISELVRPNNREYVTVINYIWNGKEKSLDDR